MSESRDTMTRYLLGELSETEQTSLEEQYFSDPHVLDELARAESALVDDYARGRLGPEARQRFEQHYLAHPTRRARAAFAEALVARVDRVAAPTTSLPRAESGFASWLAALRGPRFAIAVAAACLVLAAAGAWYVTDAQRRSAAQLDARLEQQRQEREAEAAARRSAPAHPNQRPSAFVALALMVGPGQRAAPADIPTLQVLPGTQEVHLQLTLREHAYQRYRAVLRALGGGEVLRTGDLALASTGPSFTVIVPANLLPAGDYMLTLQGAIRGGALEDLSQSLFRIQPVR